MDIKDKTNNANLKKLIYENGYKQGYKAAIYAFAGLLQDNHEATGESISTASINAFIDSGTLIESIENRYRELLQKTKEEDNDNDTQNKD